MEQLDQLKAMRDEAVKMRNEAKERLEAKLREIQTGPDARLIEGLGPIIEGYEKVLGVSADLEEPEKTVSKNVNETEDDVSDVGALKAVEGAEPEPVGAEADSAEETAEKEGTAKKPAPKKAASTKPKLMSHKELTKPKAEKAAEAKTEEKPSEPPVKKAEPAPAPEPKPAPAARSEPETKPEAAKSEPAKEEMSLEDSLEAELLGEFGTS